MGGINSLKEYLLHYSWDLAYGNYEENILKKGLSASDYIIVRNPYRGKKWFADPFIYKDSSDFLELFVEEFDYSIGRGRIGHLVISKKNNRIEKLSIILERDTHLSFPAIYKFDDKVYVHPENSASGKSVLYRYDDGIDKLVEPVVLLEEPVTDAIIGKTDCGRYQMFATKIPVQNGKELFVYESSSFWGPYIFKGKQVFDKAIARNAGALIVKNTGVTIRPSQDCDRGDYGKAIHFMQGDRIVSSLLPPFRQYAGIHTFNKEMDTFIVDLKRYDYPWLYCLRTKVRNLFYIDSIN